MHTYRIRAFGRHLAIFSAATAIAASLLLTGANGIHLAQAANNIVVTSNLDSGANTLRAAIATALADTTADDITFSGVSNIILSSGELDLIGGTNTALITIDGGSGVTIDANHTSRVFNIGSGETVALQNLTIQNGVAGGENGGGVHNSGTLTISNSTLSGNSATFGGGGVYNVGTLMISNSTLSGNSVINNGNGGGVYNLDNGTATISNSTLSGNSAYYGGGVFNNNGETLTISNSTLSGNSAHFGGGVDNSGTLTISNSTLSGNSATNSGLGGGVGNSETLTISNSTLFGNSAADGWRGVQLRQH